MSVVVKICGITNLPDAHAAVDAGADALGFVFHKASPRYVLPESAAAITRELPSRVVRVGVFVNAPAEEVFSTIQRCDLNLVQLHGDETFEYCVQFGVMSMKAFRMKDETSLEALKKCPTDAWLLDAYSPGKLGGTGESFNWDLALEAKRLGRPVFLAGGLTVENLGPALRWVQPFGVDVSSGVEVKPGKKDHALLRLFVRIAKTVS